MKFFKFLIIFFIFFVLITNKLEAENLKKTPFNFAFVVSNSYIILGTDADTNLAIGKPSSMFTYEDNRICIAKNTDKNQLNEKYKKIIGKKVLLGCVDGTTLVAKITDIKLISVFIPYFDLTSIDCNENEDLLSDEQKARQLWNYGNYYIVAQFSTNKPISSKIVFAVPTNTDLKIFKNDEFCENCELLNNILLDSLHRTNVYKNLQNQFESFSQGAAKWWNIANQSFWHFQLNSDETYVLMNQVAGSKCGDYYFTTFTICKFQKNKLSEIQFLSVEDMYFLLVAADIDGDEQIEFVLDNHFGKRIVLKLQQNNQFRLIYQWNVPYMNDPC